MKHGLQVLGLFVWCALTACGAKHPEIRMSELNYGDSYIVYAWEMDDNERRMIRWLGSSALKRSARK